ncbi:hypothetical protein SERLA73DRAFT_145644 [Serpula lacrymans var. lacrymans S7.3]|uniref:Uncharacterized protein n=1 Tax=Serpula lacrymans var. lacrymans (strain S7.3) TaxID=936435 RepID=F8QEC6_SERL3|nr:hypothetical protein SERLA73DRAFT_145644 [Serpula lacrymans var. lacrymans S7.3]
MNDDIKVLLGCVQETSAATNCKRPEDHPESNFLTFVLDPVYEEILFVRQSSR